MLPRHSPLWGIVHAHPQSWRSDSTLERVQDAPCEQVRGAEGREASPSAAILDSQSVKTDGQKAGCWGYDSGMKVTGRKRHILVDTLALVAVVHGADVQDREGARLGFARLHDRAPRLVRIWADAGYRGQLIPWLLTWGRCILQVVPRRAEQKGIHVVPKRWMSIPSRSSASADACAKNARHSLKAEEPACIFP